MLTKSAQRADLIVGGTLDVSGGENFNGNTVVSSCQNIIRYTMTNGNGEANPLEGSPIDFETEANYLQCASYSWAALPTNTTVSVEYGGLTLSGNDTNLNIFKFDGTNIHDSGYALADLNEIDIVAPLGSTILITVTGSALGFGSYSIFRNGNAATGEQAQHILWNLPEAVSLAPNTTSIKGSLLAPFALYSSGYSNIDGTLIVKSLTGNIEAHNFLFTGSLPETRCTAPDPPPEPGSVSDTCPYFQSTSDVLESIALEQTALSHILNAEGEKVQKAVAMDLNTNELLAINNSVIQMVSAVSDLEQLLLNKVKIAKAICEPNSEQTES